MPGLDGARTGARDGQGAVRRVFEDLEPPGSTFVEWTRDLTGPKEGGMNKSGLTERVAGRLGMGNSGAADAVDAVLGEIAESLAQGEDVRLAGFGRFWVRDRAARSGRNPRTGESVPVPASKAPAFKPGLVLRDAVNGVRE